METFHSKKGFMKLKQLKNKGFTLIELVIVIAIIAVLGTAVFLNIRPQDLLANTRNSNRKQDARNMATALNKALANGDITLISTGGTDVSAPTSRTSIDTAPTNFVVTGTGYVSFTPNVVGNKLDLSKLPSDPLNGTALPTGALAFAGDSKYKFAYCSNGTDYEINVYLENDTKNEMKTDGGNNDNAYEVGSNISGLTCN